MADRIPDFDPLDERYRWCVYCGADCWPDEPDHDGECPSVTGRFPVDHPAEKGSPPDRCGRCGGSFGDYYCQIEIEPGPVPVYLVVCEDCALAVDLLGADRG